MVSSDAAAWYIHACILRSTNKNLLALHTIVFYIFHKTMYIKTIIEFGFLFSWRLCNQPRPPTSADYTCFNLDYSGYHKNLIQLFFKIGT